MSLYDDATNAKKACIGRMPEAMREQARDYLDRKSTRCRPTSLRNIAYALRDYLDFIGDQPQNPGVDALHRFAQP